MANSANTEQVKYKAVSGRMCDYFGFKLCDDGTVYSEKSVILVHYRPNYVSIIIIKVMEN